MEVELESEVADWYLGLAPNDQDIVFVHVDLLEEFGHRLRMPHSKALSGGLFELRFMMDRQAWRIPYWYRPDGVAVLLTVFRKQRNNERREVTRAVNALEHCRARHQDSERG